MVSKLFLIKELAGCRDLSCCIFIDSSKGHKKKKSKDRDREKERDKVSPTTI